MMRHMCDHSACDRVATFNIFYDTPVNHVEVCTEHISWIVTLGVDNMGCKVFLFERMPDGR